MDIINKKICISTIYRDADKPIENFVRYHDAMGFDVVLVIDTTGTMTEKVTSSILSKKVAFVSLSDTEAASTDDHLVNAIILPHCKKNSIDWLIHLNIDDRVHFNGNFGDIHSFMRCKPDCDGIVILKVKPRCTCKGEARCITKVKCTIGYECEWRWKYMSKNNSTIIRGSTNEIYRHGEYDRYQSVLRSKSGKSNELIQILHCSYVDYRSTGWTNYLKSFIVSDKNTDEDEHDKDCILYKKEREDKEEKDDEVEKNA